MNNELDPAASEGKTVPGEIEKISPTPLEKIGLSLSGGGYRAATFHLGSMSYLNKLQFGDKRLLEHVKMISTVSGGTITGIAYSLGKQRGDSFDTIYRFLLKKLKEVDLVAAGIEKLSPGGHWDNQYKHRNFINAFAELYDKEFTGGITFNEFTTMKSHLEAVVFNSTEFDNGINFRFRSPGSGFFGNYKKRVPLEATKEVKLADAMAASSAFTGGFEPMIWPHDFRHDNAPHLLAMKDSEPLGLMDGGIYDNQGIESLLNHKKNAKDTYFDLIIVSDVTSPYMNGYRPVTSVPDNKWTRLSINGILEQSRKINFKINLGLIILAVLAAALPFIFYKGYRNNALTGIAVTVSVISLLLLVGKNLAIAVIRNKTNGLNDWLQKILGTHFSPRFAKLKIQEISFAKLLPLLLDRGKSLYTLAMDVFLKVIRRLNYYKLYADKKYAFRRINNMMRELTEEDYNNKGKEKRNDEPSQSGTVTRSTMTGPYDEVVGPLIKKTTEDACTFGTTLWFTEGELLDNMLNKLVACGQFTMCYNLIVYLESVIYGVDNGYDQLTVETRRKLETLYQVCKTDWEEFKVQPEKMV
jgi:predicted acylesterase/phospholipase RssA